MSRVVVKAEQRVSTFHPPSVVLYGARVKLTRGAVGVGSVIVQPQLYVKLVEHKACVERAEGLGRVFESVVGVPIKIIYIKLSEQGLVKERFRWIGGRGETGLT